MEILENNEKNNNTKTFTSSEIRLSNRELLNITGVEKVYESNNNKLQVRVAGVNMLVTGENLNIVKLDVDSGVVEVSGLVNEIKYIGDSKSNFFKRLFK